MVSWPKKADHRFSSQTNFYFGTQTLDEKKLRRNQNEAKVWDGASLLFELKMSLNRARLKPELLTEPGYRLSQLVDFLLKCP